MTEYYKIAYISGIRHELLKDDIWSFVIQDYLIAVITHDPQVNILKKVLKSYSINSMEKVKVKIEDYLPVEIF